MITKWDFGKAIATSVIATVVIQLATDLLFGSDYTTNLTDAQVAQIKTMPYQDAIAFLTAHQIPATLWTRIEWAFYWQIFLPRFIVVAPIVILSSVGLLYWSKKRVA